MTLLAKQIILLMYGNEYVESISILRLVVWFTTFSYLGIIRNIWLLSEKKQKYLWVINMSGALLNVMLNYCLIPRYGAVGAASASVVSQFFTNVIVGFIISPIRENNKLMIYGLSPIHLTRYAYMVFHSTMKRVSKSK